MLQFNKYQTPLTDELLESLPKEVQDQLLDILNNVEFVRRLVSPNRQYAKDRPRDEKGRIIVDLANPHIIENINYFRPTAIHYQKYGCFTNLRPNANPNSEYGKWIREERRRCWEGYVRESDGEWVTGYMYWFLNYSPIMLSKIIKGTKRANRIEDFPEFWEGIYWRFHYMEQAANGGLYNNFEGGEHCAELASRGKGKSFSLASILSHDFILGVNREAHRRIMSVVTAYQKEFLTKDGVLNKFSSMINFCAEHTQFPRKRLKSSMQEMTWIMGYKDVELDVERGTLNNILGVSSKDDESKLRGKRAAHILIEEFGTFPRLTDMYNVLTPSVEEGDIVFGQIYMLGCVCAGTKVWTLDGRNINIEDLKKEDGIIGYSKLPVIKDNYVIYNNGITRESIGKVIEPVEKDCVKITLSNGNTLMCSTDHPIFVQTKSSRRLCSYKDSNRRKTIFSESFVKANQLKVGDRVCECRKIDVFGNNTLFDSRLVGMLIGDGSYGNNETPKYSSEDRELLEYVKGKYDTSLSATHITKKGNVYEDIRVKGICSYLKEIGIYGQVKQAKRLPSNYQTLTRNATIDLLSGLYDTDGTFYSKGTKSYIGLTQCNIEILKEVQVLWRKFGVICSIRKTNPRLSPNRKDRNPWFTLIINGADNLKLASRVLSPLVTHKNKSNQEILSFFDTYVPKKIKGYNKDYLVYKVVSIEDIGKQVVYNLSACTSRTYLANNIITHNTAGDKESDFAGAQEIMYNPKGYRMYALPNVFDKNNQGRPNFVFFFPGYVNRKGCYNKDGVSDVVKALIEILMNRYTKKYNSSDPNTIIKVIAEVPITPAEAIVKTGVNMFPVTDLTERLGQLDNNPREFDDVYTGELIIAKNGNIEFKPSFKQPIREFPHKDNKLEGALEMFVLPEIDKSTGKPYSNRYIAGCLKEGEYVNTNSGFKKVEEVTLDDKLINIDGQEVKIHNLQRYYNKDKVYRVKLSSVIDSTVFSQEHPIYSCTPKKKYNSYTKVKKLGVPERYYEYNFDFKKVSELKVGDYVKSPILYTKEIVPSLYNDPDIWYLFGVLVGDGWASSNGYNINIAFNRAEKELIERCKLIVENKIGRKFTFVKDNGNCIEYSFCHKELNEYFSKYFGREAFNKHIDFSLKTIPYILRKNFILGYIDTDGSITGQSVNIVSTSKTLLCDIQDWLFSLGIVSSVKVLRLESVCTIEGRECQCKKAYQLNIGTEGLNAIKNWNIYGMKVSHYNVISTTNHNRREVFIKDGYIYLKVKKIIKEDYTGYVYNFECDTHTFMCNYIPTHNCDPYDDDTSNTMSLGSIFILDLFTDKIVAEYTGRPLFADDFYEICRRMCLYYNARMNYENNKKGLFTYFSKRNCVYLLTDQLESLSDKQLIKEGSYGNKAKGTNATEAINNYGRERLRSWLLAPITTIQEVDGEPTEVSIPALFTLRSRALIKELINYNQQGNFDRISAMGMLMLLREDRIVQYQGNISKERQEQAKSNYLGNDDFFNRNYKKRQ